MSQFFGANPAGRAPSGPKQGPWSRELPRTWRAALGLDDALPEAALATGSYRLGPDDGTLALRTRRTGAAAKAGHDLLIHVTSWEATLVVGDDPADTSIELDADGGSLRVREGTGGVQALGDDDKANIEKTIDDEILKRGHVAFRSAGAGPGVGGGVRVRGDLALADASQPIEVDLRATDDGRIVATSVATQSGWGLTPYSILFGTLKVVDEIEVRLEARLPQSP
jgi:hypothetical protein